MISKHGRALTPRAALLWSLVTSAVILLFSSIAAAQIVNTSENSSATALQEIVVTAQRREQDIQKVPIAVTAIEGDQLRELGINKAQDIAAQTPGVIFNSTATGSVSVLPTIRGVSQNDYTTHQEPPVAVYLDDTYLSSTGLLSFPLYDMSRVEILRGPQGTLFGRNATGGAIQFVTNKPSKDFEGSITVSYSSFDTRHVDGFVSGPLADNLQARLSFVLEKANPWWQNESPPTVEGGNGSSYGKNTVSGRGQFEWEPVDSVDNLLTFSRSLDIKHEEGAYKSVPAAVGPYGLGYIISPTSTTNGICPGCDAFGYRDPNIGSPFESSWNGVGFIQRQYNTVINRFTWKGPGFDVTSITNYQTFRYDYKEDCDGTPLDVCTFVLGQTMHQASEELRLSGSTKALDWTAGVYFLDIDQHNYQGYGTGITSPSNPLYVYAFSDIENFPQDIKSSAIFGQTDYHFAPDWTLTTGLRLSDDKKDFQSATYPVSYGAYYTPSGPAFYEYPENTERTTEWTGKAQVSWNLSPENMLYGGVVRGAKGPGFNSTPSGALPAGYSVPFGSEHLLDYEVGDKLTFWDGKARINSSLYYYDYKGYQAFNFVLFTAIVQNRNAELYGGEIEALVNPAPGWQISLGLSGEQGTVFDVLLPTGGILDRLPPQMPHFTTNGYVKKEWRTPIGKLSAEVNGRYTGNRYASVSNAPDTLLPGAAIFNARVGWSDPKEHWNVALWVNNFLDKAAYSYAFDNAAFYGNAAYGYFLPRWYGIDLNYHW